MFKQGQIDRRWSLDEAGCCGLDIKELLHAVNYELLNIPRVTSIASPDRTGGAGGVAVCCVIGRDRVPRDIDAAPRRSNFRAVDPEFKILEFAPDPPDTPRARHKAAADTDQGALRGSGGGERRDSRRSSGAGANSCHGGGSSAALTPKRPLGIDGQVARARAVSLEPRDEVFQIGLEVGAEARMLESVFDGCAADRPNLLPQS